MSHRGGTASSQTDYDDVRGGEEDTRPDDDTPHLPVCEDEVSSEEQSCSSLDQEDPEHPHIKEEQDELLQRPEDVHRPIMTLGVKSEEEEDDEDDKNRVTEPVAGTSTQHVKTQAAVEDCGTSQPTSDNQLPSSRRSESDNENGGKRGPSIYKSPLNTLMPRKTQQQQRVGGRGSPSRNKASREDPKPSKGTRSAQSRRRTGKNSFTCAVCSKTFNRKDNLKMHMTLHTGEKPFSCSVCGKGFSHECLLKRHMMTHTGEKPFACTLCGHRCFQKSDLKTHMMTHTGDKPFMCSVCGNGFTHSCHLKRHMVIHTGKKPFTCTECGHSFVQKAYLKRHMRTHTGEKSFSCTLCTKAFCDKSDLKRHMMTHTGEKPFTCKVCGKGFTHFCHLKRHMITHTGEKPFTCKVCSKGFSRNGCLKKHLKTHAGEEQFNAFTA